jgi:hypothetical protein
VALVDAPTLDMRVDWFIVGTAKVVLYHARDVRRKNQCHFRPLPELHQ